MANVKTLLVLALLFILSSCVSSERSFFKQKYLNLERIKEVEKDAVNFQTCAGENQLTNHQPVATDSVQVNEVTVLQEQERNFCESIIPGLPNEKVNTLQNSYVQSNTEEPDHLQEKLPVVKRQEFLDTETEKDKHKKSLKAQSIWFGVGALLMIAAFWFASVHGLVFFWVLGTLALIACIISFIYGIRYFVEMTARPKDTKTRGVDALNFLMLVGSLIASGFFGFLGILILIVNFG